VCVLRTAAIVFCDRCERATARFERGWRAYVVGDADRMRCVKVVCPECAERLFGEDEPVSSE